MVFSLCPKPSAIRKCEENRVPGGNDTAWQGCVHWRVSESCVCQTPGVDGPPCAQSPWLAVLPFCELPDGSTPFPSSSSTSWRLLSLLQMQMFQGHLWVFLLLRSRPSAVGALALVEKADFFLTLLPSNASPKNAFLSQLSIFIVTTWRNHADPMDSVLPWILSATQKDKLD